MGCPVNGSNANRIAVMSLHPEDKHLIEAFMGGPFAFVEADWNSLMPVIQKVQSLWDRYPMEDWRDYDAFSPYLDVIAMPLSSTIEEVTNKLLNFIKWHNQQKL